MSDIPANDGTPDEGINAADPTAVDFSKHMMGAITDALDEWTSRHGKVDAVWWLAFIRVLSNEFLSSDGDDGGD